jgi:molybdopterin synthase sulfur carrier subunit
VTSRTIRVVLPYHLRSLAGTGKEVVVQVAGEPTQRLVIDALEAGYPSLRNTVRDGVTGRRRAHVRFFACEEDISHDSPDAVLPQAVADGTEPFFIVGAMAGG